MNLICLIFGHKKPFDKHEVVWKFGKFGMHKYRQPRPIIYFCPRCHWEVKND